MARSPRTFPELPYFFCSDLFAEKVILYLPVIMDHDDNPTGRILGRGGDTVRLLRLATRANIVVHTDPVAFYSAAEVDPGLAQRLGQPRVTVRVPKSDPNRWRKLHLAVALIQALMHSEGKFRRVLRTLTENGTLSEVQPGGHIPWDIFYAIDITRAGAVPQNQNHRPRHRLVPYSSYQF